MGAVGIAAIAVYLILALIVSCTVYKENDLSLDVRMTPANRRMAAGLDETRDLEGNQTLTNIFSFDADHNDPDKQGLMRSVPAN